MSVVEEREFMDHQIIIIIVVMKNYSKFSSTAPPDCRECVPTYMWNKPVQYFPNYITDALLCLSIFP